MKKLFWAMCPILVCTLLVFLSAQLDTSSEIRLLSSQEMVETIGALGVGIDVWMVGTMFGTLGAH